MRPSTRKGGFLWRSTCNILVGQHVPRKLHCPSEGEPGCFGKYTEAMAKRKIDRGTVIGLLTAVCGVTAGLWLDGGKISQILQPTAALIVIGGTLGAVMIQFPWHTLRATVKELRYALLESTPLHPEQVEELSLIH